MNLDSGLDQSAFSQQLRLILTCLSVAANTLTAGGVFIFPILATHLTSHLKLTQPQLTTIALAGMAGQYPFAVFAGKAIDNYGPWICSLTASLLFSFGFGMFAFEVSHTSKNIPFASYASFLRLAIYFLLCSIGTLNSYFSALFAANKNFPSYLGVATGTSMALFGLSPLFLTTIASTFFTDETGNLDVVPFLASLAVICGTVNFIGAFTLRVPPTPIFIDTTVVPQITDDENPDVDVIDETTPLISGDTSAQADNTSLNNNQTLTQLLTDKYFLLLSLVAFVVLGTSEMVISNIGSIVLSLPSSNISYKDFPSTVAVTATQVRLLSLANTISRLLVGPLADFVSPVASYVSDGVSQYPRKHRISRVAFLSASCILLIITYGWMEIGIHTQSALWAFSLGTGIAYGTAFTVLPSILSSIWGMNNVARNFGVITYAPFIGTSLFSYLYAFVSEAHVPKTPSGEPQSGICKGVECWQVTFAITIVAAKVGLTISIILWRQWKGRV